MISPKSVLTSLALLAMASLLLLIIYGDKGWIELKDLEKERNRLMDGSETLSQENQLLRNAIDRLKSDPEYIESIARKELRMIGKDEVIFKPGASAEADEAEEAGKTEKTGAMHKRE